MLIDKGKQDSLSVFGLIKVVPLTAIVGLGLKWALLIGANPVKFAIFVGEGSKRLWRIVDVVEGGIVLGIAKEDRLLHVGAVQLARHSIDRKGRNICNIHNVLLSDVLVKDGLEPAIDIVRAEESLVLGVEGRGIVVGHLAGLENVGSRPGLYIGELFGVEAIRLEEGIAGSAKGQQKNLARLEVFVAIDPIHNARRIPVLDHSIAGGEPVLGFAVVAQIVGQHVEARVVEHFVQFDVVDGDLELSVGVVFEHSRLVGRSPGLVTNDREFLGSILWDVPGGDPTIVDECREKGIFVVHAVILRSAVSRQGSLVLTPGSAHDGMAHSNASLTLDFCKVGWCLLGVGHCVACTIVCFVLCSLVIFACF